MRGHPAFFEIAGRPAFQFELIIGKLLFGEFFEGLDLLL